MKIRVIDTETSSLQFLKADILEVAVADVDLETGSIDLLIDTLIQPIKPAVEWQNCWFMQNAGLGPEDFLQAPHFSDIAGRLSELVNGMPITAYNLHFDMTMLNTQGIHIGKFFPCLMETCTPILRIENWKGGWKYPTFQEAWKHFFPSKPFKQIHRAGSDAYHESQLAFILAKRGYFMLRDEQYNYERNKRVCAGCGGEKDIGLIVCWNCFKRRQDITPFKDYSGRFEEWIKEYGLPKPMNIRGEK